MVHRLIIDAPARGAWNMSVDEALFQCAANGVETVLRLYQWSEPTLSLGYFQSTANRDTHAASRHLPWVRRSTGGGAIVHDRELTYSLVTHLPDERPAGPRRLISRVHQSLVDLFKEMRIDAKICDGSETTSTEPFLCFARHTAGDILIGSEKVVGSAQRRHRRVLLQHGSILLNRSSGAPELPGISDVSAVTCTIQWLIEAWPKRVQEFLPGPWSDSQLTTRERDLAEFVEGERFGNPRWNLKR